MERMRDHGRTETELDMGLVEKALAANRLKGMTDVVQLVTALHRARTFEALQAALDAPEHWNPFGNFEVSTADIGLAQSIMGTPPPGYDTPKRYVLVARGAILDLVAPVIEEARQEAIEREEEAQGNEPPPHTGESRNLAA
jgi:hypothetical protein